MGSPAVNPQQFQYIKLPDGSYGKFRSDATDEQIKGMITKDFPDAFAAKPQERSFLDHMANDPNNIPLDSHLHATESGLADVGQGIAQAIQGAGHAIAHPIDTVKGMLVGAKELPSQTAAVIKNPPDLADFGHVAGQTAGQLIPGIVAPEAAGAVKAITPSVKTLTAPVRMAARSAEGLGAIPGVGPALKTLRKAAYVNTPVEEIPKFKMPLQDFGLPRGAGAPLPEAPTPAQHLESRIATERGLSTEQLAQPVRAEGLPEVEAGQPQAEQHLRSAVDAQRTRADQPIAPPTDTSRANVGKLLNNATGGQALKPNVPIKNQLTAVTPIESSVVKSHSYDPGTRELTVQTKAGTGYIHGDVSPEQAAAMDSGSKGKAWNNIRSNSTLVAKIVNGKRVAVQPPKASRIAGPNDLTPILQQSLDSIKKKP